MSVSTSLASSSAKFTFVHLKVPSFSPPPHFDFVFSPPPPPFCFSSVALFPTAVSYTLPFSPSSIVLLSPPFLVRSLFQYFLMRSLKLLSANALLISKEPYHRPLIWPFIRTSLYKWCRPCSNSSLSPRLRIIDRPKTWLIEGLLTDKQNQLQTDLTLNGSPHNQSIPPLPPSPLPFRGNERKTTEKNPRKTKQIAKNTKSKSQPSQKQKVTKFGVFLSDPTKYINNEFRNDCANHTN